MTLVPALQVWSLDGIPRVAPGDDVAALILTAVERAGLALVDGDVLAVTSKVCSRAEGRFVALQDVTATDEACELAAQTGHDPRLVALVLAESAAVSRAAPGVLITRHRCGFVTAMAGIDQSNAGTGPGDAGERLLLLPEAPDVSARRIREALTERTGVDVAIVLTDSHSRPFRLGTIGTAIGVAGFHPLRSHVGEPDLDARPLQRTVVAVADAVAALGDLIAGQGDEGRPVTLIRGLTLAPDDDAGSGAQYRAPDEDLYV